MRLPNDLPLVTIVMPIRNEESFIEQSLGAVLKQDYPPDKVEILIADGMSDDHTIAVIQSLPGAERVQIVSNPARIQSHGLNRIIPLAQGKYIIRIDGHTIIAPDYVRKCVENLEATGADNVGGAMNPVGITPMGKAIAAAGKSPFAVPTPFHVSNTPQYTDTVYLGAWKRTIFEHVGLFNTEVGVNEDYEFNYRIRANGGTIYFDPAIQSQYFGRQTLAHLARQYYRYGRSKVKTLRTHPASLRPRQVVAPMFLAGLITGPVLSIFTRFLLLVWAGCITVYFFLSLIFARRIAQTVDGGVATWRIVLVFFTIHSAWGLGFWRELFKPDAL